MEKKGTTMEQSILKQAAASGAEQALLISVLSYMHKKSVIEVPIEGKKHKGKYKMKSSRTVNPFDDISRKKRRMRKKLVRHCSINILIKKIKVSSGEILSSREYRKSVQMDTRKEADNYLFSSFRRTIKGYFRTAYKLETEIIKVDFDRLVLRLGRNMGIPKNTLFKIKTRGRTEYVGEEEHEFPGEVVALVRVLEVGEDASVAYLIRQWDHINIDYQAVETLRKPRVWRFMARYNPPFNCMGGGVQYLFNPLGRWNFQMGFHMARLLDSRNEGNIGFGLELAATYRMPVAHTFRLKPGIGYAFDGASKEDDGGSAVTNTVHSLPLILDTEWVLSKKWNFTMGAAWNIFGRSDNWLSGSESEDAVWNGNAPEVDISGPQLRMSFDYVMF
jgi:hypothetical protein